MNLASLVRHCPPPPPTLTEFPLVCSAFADFVSDVAWALKVIVEEHGAIKMFGFLAFIFLFALMM